MHTYMHTYTYTHVLNSRIETAASCTGWCELSFIFLFQSPNAAFINENRTVDVPITQAKVSAKSTTYR